MRTTTEFAPDGSARIHFRCAPGLHRVPDGIATASVADQLRTHVGPRWIACLITSSGHGVIRPSQPNMGVIGTITQALLAGITIALNYHAARAGQWVVAHNLDENEVTALWRDQDGDAQLTTTFGDPDTIAKWTDVDFATLAVTALDHTEETHRALEKDRQPTIRRALGEQPDRRTVH